MQLDTDYMENMAREYAETVNAPALRANASPDVLSDQLATLLEAQLDTINNMLNFPLNRITNKLLNYLRTLQYNALRVLFRLSGLGEYAPSFRNPERLCNFPLARTRLLDSQIDVFVLLDKLFQKNPDISELLLLENRAMAIIAAL